MKCVIFLSLLLAGVAAVDIQGLLDTTFYDVQGNAVTLDDLKGKYIGLYFSASWCGPCRRFTPSLIWTYNEVLKAGHNFEIIWVSRDRYESSAEDFFQKMPWVRLPWSENYKIGQLFSLTQQRYIPALTILDPDLNVINPNARSDAEYRPEQFPWRR
ncbi:hypothetical protein ACHWQZ_G016479 [Mnemiopsis leidyi]